MVQETRRTVKDVETGIDWKLYFDPVSSRNIIGMDAHNDPKLPAEGSEVNGWYLVGAVEADIRLNTNKVIRLNNWEFYNLKENEEVTHIKYIGLDNRFRKIRN